MFERCRAEGSAGNDLIGYLLRANDSGRTLDDAHVIELVRQFLPAAAETTTLSAACPAFLPNRCPSIWLGYRAGSTDWFASGALAYDKYPSANQMFDLMGFGYAPDDPAPAFVNIELVGDTWRHSGMLVADVLGLPIDRIENLRNVVTTDRDLHVAAGAIKAGTVGAMNSACG